MWCCFTRFLSISKGTSPKYTWAHTVIGIHQQNYNYIDPSIPIVDCIDPSVPILDYIDPSVPILDYIDRFVPVLHYVDNSQNCQALNMN